ncbi:TPA: hypothetical protein SMQ89_001208 [Pseudomonas aeruginosa]|nr:hypothetical protein [Pseudomonas aeruginosa]
MTESKICTCPSGNGSLRHPCPAHPASVEQAGGDERAAFRPAQVISYRPGVGEVTIYVAGRVPGYMNIGDTVYVSDRAPVEQPSAALAQPSPVQAEQAEAERPEMSPERAAYFMRRFKSEEKLLGPNEQAAVDYVLSLLAQHDRIVGELRDELEAERKRVNIYVNNNRIRQDNERLRAELRDALARVAELERGKVYVEARQCDECQHGGINDSATGVAACHECDWTGPESEEDKCPGCQRENCMAAACPQCGARYVLVASEEIAAPVAQAQQLHDLDKQCRDDVARALGLRPSQERGFAWSYLLASIKSCVKASEDAAQAQHSVPAYVSYTTRPAESLAGIALRQLKEESRWVEIRDINAPAFPDMQSHSYYPAGTVIKLPAAAPGKEVGHE